MVVTTNYVNNIPRGVVTGDRAATIQFYDEMNKKRGKQWEASRRVTNVAAGAKLYSVIKTGQLPIDLKSRELGYTGDGVAGSMYIISAGSEITDGLTEDEVGNMRASGGVRDFSLFSIPDGVVDQIFLDSNTTKFGDTIFSEGQGSNQSKGHVPYPAGSNHILNLPNTEYLLEIESYSLQNITARLEMYNGVLDWPLPFGLY